jgi:hypothetical protein
MEMGEGNADNLMERREPGTGEVGREAMAKRCRPKGNAEKNDGGRESGSTGNVGGMRDQREKPCQGEIIDEGKSKGKGGKDQYLLPSKI